MTYMEDKFRQAADIIKKSKNTIALTGAGVSVESGIPDFRSAGGLWDKYDPSEYAHIDSFRRHPEKIWNMIFDLRDITTNARPNPAHIAMAKMEEMNLLSAVITQNIDNLHQAAGSRNVIEFHGNASRLECIHCGASFGADEYEVAPGVPPRCRACKEILKPSVIFFGEAIPVRALAESETAGQPRRGDPRGGDLGGGIPREQHTLHRQVARRPGHRDEHGNDGAHGLHHRRVHPGAGGRNTAQAPRAPPGVRRPGPDLRSCATLWIPCREYRYFPTP